MAAALSKPGFGVAATRALVSCGGNVNYADFLGRTPLLYAAENRNVSLMEVLLDEGADTECTFRYHQQVNDAGNKWNLLLEKVCTFKIVTTDKLISFQLLPPDVWGRTPLHIAVKNAHIEAVKLLIHRGAKVNAKDSTGLTPLLLAGYKQDEATFEELVEILVENGADVNIKNSVTGTTALLHAVALKSLKATRLLLKAGAWIQENLCKQTELHEAASKGLLEILKLFLDDPRMTPHDINKIDSRGRSALHR